MKKIFIILIVLMAINAPLYISYLLIKGISFKEYKESCCQMANQDEEELKYTLQLMNQQQLVIATILILVYLLVWWII